MLARDYSSLARFVRHAQKVTLPRCCRYMANE